MKIASAAALILALVGGYQNQKAAVPTWKRQYIEKTPFSIELPSELKQQSVQNVTDPKDWVSKVTDYSFADNDVFASITLFEGREPGKMDKTFLKKVLDDFLKGVQGEESKATLIRSDEKPIDGAPAFKAAYRVTSDKDTVYYLQVGFLVGAGRVYLIALVHFDEKGLPSQRAKRVIDSMRFKTGT